VTMESNPAKNAIGTCAIIVPLQVMLPRFWVASTKPEAALVRSQG
jgi:hypothetical protein